MFTKSKQNDYLLLKNLCICFILCLRFHAFAFNKLESDVSGTSGYNTDKKILHGGVPPGAGARDDVVKMWSELEEARNILVDIQELCKDAPSNGKSEQSKFEVII